ncbi:MAG: 2-oxoacid:acceptor oxidoreductase subunit alpha [Firmicutes bacterium]|nr:2-oxoacid:acceptor oxidoreductase subunit alpha [Bacillota bacterium]
MNILIGGAAGQGLDTIAHLLGKSLQRFGFGVLTSKDYMSRVRGGHNFSCLRIEQETPWASAQEIQLLIALNEETYSLHKGNLTPQGRIIFDPDHVSLPNEEKRGLPIALRELAKEAGAAIMANSVAVGAALALLGLTTNVTEQLLHEVFAQKIATSNGKALRAGYDEVAKTNHTYFTLPAPMEKKQIFIDGNSLLGMSALASGCRFLSAYPMTPATGIMTYLAAKQENHDVVVEQAEDEIAAINMALGASYTGARAMTCTSGGGFALMTEGLSLAGMTETPLVIVVAMRPGPATGLPTRTGQADLEFVLHAGHGEFPRAVLSATHLEDAFYRINKAFELADKYQIPVIFLSDQDFADTVRTLPPFDFTLLQHNRYLLDDDVLTSPYQRYLFTDDGISPRALPGQFAGEVVLADSDEHDEDGHIIEDAEARARMSEKRQKKLVALAAEMSEPEVDGADEGDLLLIGWGSTYGVIKEATHALRAQGQRVTHVHFADLWPLPTATINKLFSHFPHSVCVEGNATGQFAKLLRRETGHLVDQLILKYDGRPFWANEIVKEVINYD